MTPQTLYEAGDALRGDRIAVAARKIRRQVVVPHSSRDQAIAARLEGSAYCVIERPFKGLQK